MVNGRRTTEVRTIDMMQYLAPLFRYKHLLLNWVQDWHCSSKSRYIWILFLAMKRSFLEGGLRYLCLSTMLVYGIWEQRISTGGILAKKLTWESSILMILATRQNYPSRTMFSIVVLWATCKSKEKATPYASLYLCARNPLS